MNMNYPDLFNTILNCSKQLSNLLNQIQNLTLNYFRLNLSLFLKGC